MSADCPNDDEDIVFADRVEAGRKLAVRLLKYRGSAAGGSGCAARRRTGRLRSRARAQGTARRKIVRKLGAPGEPEPGVGAVVDGDHPETILNREVVSTLRVSRAYFNARFMTN